LSVYNTKKGNRLKKKWGKTGNTYIGKRNEKGERREKRG